MKKYFKEAILWVLIITPYIYLASIWQQLPDRVPIHFNLEGVADDWSGKNFLFFMPTGLGAFIYLLMLALPYIDPKKKIISMGEKYTSFRFILTVFFSFLAIYFLYVSKAGDIKNPNSLMVMMGIMFALYGNYFQTVRPNYFLGIRTPWTLESETVWKKTHRLGGRLWMAGGVLLTILAFCISNKHILSTVFIVMISLMIIIPFVFSYIEFRKEKKAINQ